MVVSNKIPFFSCPGPLSIASNINIKNKKICILQNVLQNALFFFTNLSQGNFYIA